MKSRREEACGRAGHMTSMIGIGVYMPSHFAFLNIYHVYNVSANLNEVF